MLRNDEESRTALGPHELPEMSRLGRLGVRHEDAAIACRTGKDFPVVQARQTGCRGGSESMAGTRLTTANTMT